MKLKCTDSYLGLGPWCMVAFFLLASLPASSTNNARCDRFQDAIHIDREKLISEHNSCEKDVDCILVNSGISCSVGCQAGVATTNESAFNESLSNIEFEHCSKPEAVQCTVKVKCGWTKNVKCEEGICKPIY